MNIDGLEIWTQRLDPMRAEVRVRLGPAETGLEVRGRLMGPRCRFATTVEVAYPFRPGAAAGEFAAIVPEPSFWDPKSPFFYEGPVECWSQGNLVGQTWARQCFRSLKLGPGGLILNGQPLPLHGLDMTGAGLPAEAELLELRRLGFNAVLVSAETAGMKELGDLADSIGFLIVARGPEGEGFFFCALPHTPAKMLKLPAIVGKENGTFTTPTATP